VLAGRDKPRDAEEAATFAQLCSDRSLHQRAVQFWTEALAADPKLALDRQYQYRTLAAFDAALAGCGHGRDVPAPDGPARAKLRSQALLWLAADLKAWSEFLESAPFSARPLGFDALYYWNYNFDLAGVRDSEALARLADVERREWQAFWTEYERVRQSRKIKPCLCSSSRAHDKGAARAGIVPRAG